MAQKVKSPPATASENERKLDIDPSEIDYLIKRANEMTLAETSFFGIWTWRTRVLKILNEMKGNTDG